MYRTKLKRFTALAVAVVLVAVLFHVTPRYAAAAWTTSTFGAWKTWLWDDAPKFRYDSVVHMWRHYSAVDAKWYDLSSGGPEPTVTFIGDGQYWNLGNGLRYRYGVQADAGVWSRTNQDSGIRFLYRYYSGFWQHRDYLQAYRVLSDVGTSAAVLCDGQYHLLGARRVLQYRYGLQSDIGLWSRTNQDSGTRFLYRYYNGSWQHRAYDGTDHSLGGAGEAATGRIDGTYGYYFGNGLWYRYGVAADAGCLSRTNNDSGLRLMYSYADGQWRHKGYDGLYPYFGDEHRVWLNMGPDDELSLGDGFSFRYDLLEDAGYWKHLHLLVERFAYQYDTGQWEHRRNDSSSWYNLGAEGRSAAFVGTSKYETPKYKDLGDGFWFRYEFILNVSDGASWSRTSDGAGDRFHYWYSTGMWSHRGFGGDTWHVLGVAGLSANFVGTPDYKSLGDGWWYQYLASFDLADWSRDGSDTGDRFRYYYTSGQWQHRGYGGVFFNIGTAGIAADFIGTWHVGVEHQIGNRRLFYYFYDQDKCLITNYDPNGEYPPRAGYDYEYSTGLWSHKDISGTAPLGHGEMSAEFVGDGKWHSLLNGYKYSYYEDGNSALWVHEVTVGDSYKYEYGPICTWYRWNVALQGWDTLPGGGIGRYNPGE